MNQIRNLFFLALAACGPLACVPNPEPECYERPVEKDGPWILADHYHSRKQNPEDYVLTKTDYNYQGVFGFRRLFDHLERGDYNWTSVRTMGLSPERLEGFDVLFINLVSSDRPDFTPEEVDAILDFVEKGGGLYVIVDHTNVYQHAQRVNPFLQPMGIDVLYSIAVDYPPKYSVAGLGWIMVWSFTDHPVAEGLEMVSLQTGGAMESDEGAVALTSEESFADFWDPEDKGGYYGNWKFDGDEEVEPKGPLEVVSAVEYGEGRVVVVADQNIFGDAWTHYGDNLELAVNGFEWAAKRDETASIPLRDIKPRGTLVGQDQVHSEFTGGKQGGNGFWVFYVNLNRDPEITGRGSIRFDNSEDVLLLLNPTVDFTADDIEAVRAYLKDGKKVVVSFEPDSISPATEGLLRQLAPEFSLTVGETEALAVVDGALQGLTPDRISGARLALSSEKLDVEGLKVGAYDADPDDEDVDPATVPPYLFDVTSSWGQPFLQAKAGDKTIDLARSAEVDGGELIVFVQDGFFRNRSMGHYLRAPSDFNKDAHELQYRLLDYVKVPQDDEPAPGDDDDGDDDDGGGPLDPPTRVCR